MKVSKCNIHTSHTHTVRENLRELSKEYDRSEDDLKALQSGVGQIVGEVLRQLTEDKCEYIPSYSQTRWPASYTCMVVVVNGVCMVMVVIR